MPFVQRYSDVKKGAIIFAGNTLGLSKAANSNSPGTEGSIGAFTSLNTSLQVGNFPAGTTLDYTLNGSRAQLSLPAGFKRFVRRTGLGRPLSFDSKQHFQSD